MNATRLSCRVYKNHQLKFKIQITFNNYSFFIIYLKKFTMVKSEINYQTHSLKGQEYQSSDRRSTWRVFCRLLISYRWFRTTIIIEKNLHLLYQNYLTYTALLNVSITNMQKNNKNSKIPETKQPNASNELD